MTIKILPARLANQIAAGEVVERPASVVKELVENSLDSGATRIDIDIEKGGSKLIRVRDNGKGIPKDELGLALSRHATSKIHTLDDLEAILSLGFRGEALASISSVSRLTLTSRTATQEQAWSSYSEGRDMNVKLQPSAHPVGTTVEVLDLFFNTPARRKFLRTDKTEFTHIDELLKRIALSRFDVSINLKHNGKIIRQYRAAKSDIQKEKRIAAVCGAAFVRHMLKIELEHNGLKLSGWITTPEGARQQNDLQYCYVNGRMMKDKLINHAIRQSYETSLKPDQYATYVLFIELDPHQVDVNVHPAKHEVRFHQARLVHDFIYQALAGALAQSNHIESPEHAESAYHTPSQYQQDHKQNDATQRVMEAVSSTPAYPGRDDYVRPPAPADNSAADKTSGSFGRGAPKPSSENNPWRESSSPVSKSGAGKRPGQEKAPLKAELVAYQELLTTQESVADKSAGTNTPKPETEIETAPPSVAIRSLGKAIAIAEQAYLVMSADSGLVLVSLAKAEWYRVLGQLQTDKNNLTTQPLLVPLSLKLDEAMIAAAQNNQQLLIKFGIEFKVKNSHTIMVMGVPQPLRQQNLQKLLPDLLSYATSKNNVSDEKDLAHWLTMQITRVKKGYTLSEGIQLISELEQVWGGLLPLDDSAFIQNVDFSATIANLNL